MRNLYFLVIFSVLSLSVLSQVAPTATIVKTSSLNCTNSVISYSAKVSGAVTGYTWGVSPTKDCIMNSDMNSPTISVSFSSTANHTISLKVSDANGLSSTSFTALTIYQTPKASFNASFDAPGFPTQLILTNYSSNFKTNYWAFSDTKGDSSLNINKSYSSAGNYTVTLHTYGDNGCKDSSSYDFVLANVSSLVLPTIFTPNGDGVNEIYKPISQGLSTLKAHVYNRYGVLVSSWNTVNGFWDGHTVSGEACSEGVYFVTVEALGFDGQIFKLHASITLAR